METKKNLFDRAIPLVVASAVMLAFFIFGTSMVVGDEDLMRGAAGANAIILFIAAWMKIGMFRLVTTVVCICWWVWFLIEVLVNHQTITPFTVLVIFSQPIYLAWSWLGSRVPHA
jgi:hypothetical protein